MSFEIYSLNAGGGEIGICPIPGRFGTYAADFEVVRDWAPRLVLTMVETDELRSVGAGQLAEDLVAADIAWRHLPIRDFGAPQGVTALAWPDASSGAQSVLADNGRVLVHCKGGCGRSGMAILRLLVEMGEDPQCALARLRVVRPCAVETDAQFAWAAEGGSLPKG